MDNALIFPFILSGIFGFRSNMKSKFMQIVVALPRFIATAKRILENGFAFGNVSSSVRYINYDLFVQCPFSVFYIAVAD